jgi:POT family proton-dependent oligopeptide transporter
MDDQRSTEEQALGSMGEIDQAPLNPPPTGGHPKGLWVLFITEMWERFSYYGMRALLVLYLVASTSDTLADGTANANPGFGWSDESAFMLYGLYTWAVYLLPIGGGLIADRFLGTHRSMILGGWIIAAGHVTLALTELFGFSAGEAVSMQNGPGALITFMLGLFLIVVGTGFFKPCVSVMVGQLYGKDDPRRDSGFTIFYMGINLGAFLSPLIAGYLGQKVGWHWGFGSAAVGMIAGIITYQFLRPKYLKGIGLPPHHKPEHAEGYEPTPEDIRQAEEDEYEATRKFTAIDFSRIVVILILAFVGNIFFWTAFEQAGSSMTVFADRNTDLTLWGMLDTNFPSTWYQSVNALTIVLCAPLFSILWIKLAKRNRNPSTPMKFAFGLWILGLSFLAMVFGAMEANAAADGLAGPHWLFITYVVYTWGELCLSPVGLSMVTKLAPKRLQSLMMGVWFFTFSLANLCAGLVARISTKFLPGEDGSAAEMTFFIDGLPGFYLMLVVVPIGAGIFIALISPKLKKMMHGIH